MGRQRATVVVTVLVVATLVIAIMIVVARAPGPGRDPRAYPADRGTVSLTGALARASVRIPDCLTEGLRYAVPGPSHDLYLMLSGPGPCMDHFIAINKLTPAGGTDGSALPAWASDGRAEALGWSIDAAHGYTLHTARPAADHEIEALVRALSDGSGFHTYARAT